MNLKIMELCSLIIFFRGAITKPHSMHKLVQSNTRDYKNWAVTCGKTRWPYCPGLYWFHLSIIEKIWNFAGRNSHSIHVQFNKKGDNGANTDYDKITWDVQMVVYHCFPWYATFEIKTPRKHFQNFRQSCMVCLLVKINSNFTQTVTEVYWR